MKTPKHISEVITEFLQTLTAKTMNQGISAPKVEIDERTGFKYYIDDKTGKRVRLKKGFNYDVDEDGNSLIRTSFFETDMKPVG